MSDDFYTQMKKEQEILNLSMKESIRQRDERLNAKIIWVYDREIYCDGDGEHPRVFYKIENDVGIVCGYCNIKYKYREADI